jgi:hypothetical protein
MEDEDEFGLKDVLQALQFAEAGHTWVCPKVWEVATGLCALNSPAVTSPGSPFLAQSGDASSMGGRWVRSEAALPAGAKEHLQWLRGAATSAAKQLPQGPLNSKNYEHGQWQ